jgi:hypothetical protein
MNEGNAFDITGACLMVGGIGFIAYFLYAIIKSSFNVKTMDQPLLYSGLAAIPFSVAAFSISGGYRKNCTNDYIEGLYLYNVIEKKDKYKKMLDTECPDYYYPSIDYWGTHYIKGYFLKSRRLLSDPEMVKNLSKNNPNFTHLAEENYFSSLAIMQNPATTIALSLFIIPIIGLPLYFHSMSDTEVNANKIYYDSLNIYNYNCFCLEE